MRCYLMTGAVIATIISGGSPAKADCQDAVRSYNSAIEDISSSLRRYANCVSSSRGNDECSSEFRRIRSAHNDFESAVSQHRSECQD